MKLFSLLTWDLYIFCTESWDVFAAKEEKFKSVIDSLSDNVICDELHENHECSEWLESTWNADII